MNFEIKKCNIEDVNSYTEHAIYCLTEKGIGDIFVHPFPKSHTFDQKEFAESLKKKWSAPPFSPNWEIAWIALANEKMVGHLHLRCGGIQAQVHRMKLGMSILDGHRSSGIGTSLLDTAIKWAKDKNNIDWIDLSTFSKNQAARSLYKKFGFKELFVMEDALRVENEIIDDVQMTLRLR